MGEPIIPAGAFAAMKAAQTPAPAAAPIAPPTPKEAAPEVKGEAPPEGMSAAEKKIWKLKADGEEFEFDASDEERVKREIMKARGADKRFDQAASMKKQAETFLDMLRSPDSLRKVLEDPRIGVDVKKFAKDLVWEEIQDSQLSPQEREQRAKDRELEEYKSKDQRNKEEQSAREQRERQTRFETSYEQKIMKALDVGGIPKTPEAAARMAEYLFKAVENNVDLGPEELVHQLRNDYRSDFHSYISEADGEAIMALLGDKNLEKLRQADLKRLKSAQGNPFPQRPRTPEGQFQSQTVKKVPGSVWKEDMVKSFLARPR